MASPSMKPVQMDRLPLPVSISFILSKVQEGESFMIGNKSFKKVLCIGRVVSCRSVRSLGALEYIVTDPSVVENVSKEISVLFRDESYDVSKPYEKFTRGTLVLIPGKLLRFKGTVAIQAYSIREINCPEEYECLKMEAFLALQYHTKNPSGQTPARRPSSGSHPRRSFPPVASSPPVGGKRIASPAVVSTSTPKRPNASIRSSSSSSLVHANEESAQIRKPDCEEDQPVALNNTRHSKEVGSQDSFEDNVFLRTGGI